jgi:hypothetical protein
LPGAAGDGQKPTPVHPRQNAQAFGCCGSPDGENRPAGPAGGKGSIGMQWDPLRMGPKLRDPLRYGRSTQQRSVPSHSLRSCSGPAAAKRVSVKSVPANFPACAADMRPARRGADRGQRFCWCSHATLVSCCAGRSAGLSAADGWRRSFRSGAKPNCRPIPFARMRTHVG